jgi:Eukaryotic porin
MIDKKICFEEMYAHDASMLPLRALLSPILSAAGGSRVEEEEADSHISRADSKSSSGGRIQLTDRELGITKAQREEMDRRNADSDDSGSSKKKDKKKKDKKKEQKKKSKKRDGLFPDSPVASGSDEKKKLRIRTRGAAARFDSLTSEANICEPTEAFEGVRFEYNRMVSPLFQVSHVLTGSGASVGGNPFGGAAEPDSGEYTLMAHYVHSLDPKPADGGAAWSAMSRRPSAPRDKMIMLFRGGTGGDVMTRVIGQVGPWSAKLLCQSARNRLGWQSELEYKGDDSHAGISFSSSQGISASYTQGVSRSLVLGAKLNYAHAQAESSLQLAARYENGKNVFSALGGNSASPISGAPGYGQLCYARKVTRGITWATRLLLARKQIADYEHAAIWSTGYDYRLPHVGTCKGYLDSTGHAVLSLEHQITPMMAVSLCLDVDYAHQDHRAGVGLALQL